MARADTYTLLSLDAYSYILGIAPPHFSGAAGASIFPAGGQCDAIWHQFQWQSSDRVSREELAQAIATAEEEIARVLGFWPAPMFITNEIHPYPRHYRPELITQGLTTRGQLRSIRADYAKFISAGQRGTTFVGTPAIIRSDADGDGFDETVTVSIANALTDACEVKVYFEGYDGDPESIKAAITTKSCSNRCNYRPTSHVKDIHPELWEAF